MLLVNLIRKLAYKIDITQPNRIINKPLLAIVLLSITIQLNAQDFEIVNVESLPADMSAREEMKTDHNDHQCALLRIATQNITPEQREGFTFKPDLGSEVVDRANRNGEILLWVSPGLKYLLIMHRDWGQYELRLPDYVSRIEALHTYKVTIKGTFTVAPQVQSNASPAQQYLVFQLTPPNATLEVNDQLWSVDVDGTAMKYVNFGTYTYRVRASDYFTETGEVTVNDHNNTKMVPVSLRPNFATITLKVDADAEIWVNNVKKGVRSWSGQLGSGTYKIECKEEGHETTMISKEITTEMNGLTITLPTPQPIYGSLNVESTPNICKLFIDGKEVGTTPKSIPEILIGRHVIRLTKEGYKDYTESITISKGERTQIKGSLEKSSAIQEKPSNNLSLGNKTELSFYVKGVNFKMKFVEGGAFQMGNKEKDAMDKEKPVHRVTVNSFYLGETEVTQALWEAVMGSNPSHFKGNNQPVERVSWEACQQFIQALNEITGKKFRLPTEAEWEYAARGGKRSSNYKYSGSNSLSSVGWFSGNSYNKTHNVRTKFPNELGLYDMSGNVSEWCQDYYGNYNGGSQTNPQGPFNGTSRVLRGGSWNNNERGCRISFRSSSDPSISNLSIQDSFGFRIALSE